MPPVGDLLDRRPAQVDQRHVVAVEGLEVVGVDRWALRAERIVLGHSISAVAGSFTISRILPRMNSDGDLVGVEVASVMSLKPPYEELEAALLPELLEDLPRAPRGSPPWSSARSGAYGKPPVGLAASPRRSRRSRCLISAWRCGSNARVARGHAEVRGALEHGQVLGLRGDDRASPGSRSIRCRSGPPACPARSTPSRGHWAVR